MSKLSIQIQAEKYNSLFSEDDMLDDTIQKYVDGKITRDNLIFYLYWNEFDMSDVDWRRIEKERKELRQCQ